MSFLYNSPRLMILIATMTLVVACTSSESPPELATDKAMESLVSTEWLSQHLDDPDLVVLDCTVHVEPGEGGGLHIESGRAAGTRTCFFQNPGHSFHGKNADYVVSSMRELEALLFDTE